MNSQPSRSLLPTLFWQLPSLLVLPLCHRRLTINGPRKSPSVLHCAARRHRRRLHRRRCIVVDQVAGTSTTIAKTDHHAQLVARLVLSGIGCNCSSVVRT